MVGGALHHAVAGEQCERAPSGEADQPLELGEHRVRVGLGAGVRQRGGAVEERLLSEVERRPHVDLRRVVRRQVELRCDPGWNRRGREHHRVREAGAGIGVGVALHLEPTFTRIPQQLVEGDADVERGEAHPGVVPLGLHPHDPVGRRGEEPVEVAHERVHAGLHPGDPRGDVRVRRLDAPRRLGDRNQPLTSGHEQRAHRLGDAVGEPVAHHRGDRPFDPHADGGDALDHRIVGDHPGGHPRRGGEPPRAQLDRRGRRDDVGQLVRLVDHQHVVVGQHGPAARQVQAVQVGVDHHHVGRSGAPAGVLGEAVVAAGAPAGARALAWSHAQRGPGCGRRLERQVGPIAGARLRRPRPHRGELPLGNGGRTLQPFQGPLGRIVQLVEALEAQVVGTALQHRPRDRAGPRRILEVLRHEGQLLAGQLVLQRLRGRRHHGAAAQAHGGSEVGERLPGARPRLHHHVAALGDRFGDSAAHLVLAGPVLAAAEGSGEVVEHRHGAIGRGRARSAGGGHAQL